MTQLHIAIAVMLGIVGLLALPGALGFRLRMIRLKSAELMLFLAMAGIGIIGYGDKFSPTNAPPARGSGALAASHGLLPSRNGSDAIAMSLPRSLPLITPDPGTGPFTNIAPFEVSNLCFTAIADTHTSLWAAVAWPPALSPTNDALDLYARGTLSLCDPWRLHGVLPLAPGSTNVVFELQKDALPTNGVDDSCFLSVGTQDDTDCDGLPDAFEALVSGTDPYLVDTDGDGVGDYAEVVLGSDPNDAGAPVPSASRRLSALRLVDAFSASTGDFGTNVVFERTIPVDAKGGWVQFFISASPTNAAPWSLSGAQLEWSDSLGAGGSISASPAGDSWRIPVSTGAVASVTLRLVASSPSFGSATPLHFLAYSPDAYVSGCAWSRDENGLDRFAYAGLLPHSFAVTIDRSARPCNAAPDPAEMYASPFPESPAVSYDPTNQALAVASPVVAPVRSTLESDGVLAVMGPRLRYGDGCGWRGTIVSYDAASGQYSLVPPYPLDAPCLVESWNVTTNGCRGCTCVPAFDTGIDEDALAWLETSVGFEAGWAEADVLFCGESIWHGECSHPAPGTEEDSQSDFLSDDGCGCSVGCESGNCDDIEGPSLGSVRFRIPLGIPRKGQVSGFAWFAFDSPQSVRSGTFSVLSRSDAEVTDTVSNGVRYVACSDVNGRTLEIADNPTGVCITVRNTLMQSLEHTWDIVNLSGGAVRFVKTNSKGYALDVRTYSYSDGAWFETDDITGLSVQSRRTDTIGAENGALVEERVAMDGAVTNSHTVTRSELVGSGENAVLRETMRGEMTHLGWKTAYADYWSDGDHPLRHGKPRCVWGDSRAWEYRNYDDEGRLVAIVEQLDGSEFPESLHYAEIWSAEDLPEGVVCRAEFRSYEPLAGDAENGRDVCEPRTVETFVSYGGAPIKTGARWRTVTRGTYNGWPTVSVLEEEAASQGAMQGDASNRVTRVVSFDPDSPLVPLVAHGMAAFEVGDDGVVSSNSFSFADGALRVETRTVAPSGEVAPVMRVAEYDPVQGNLLYEADALSEGGVEFGWRRHVYDGKNRLRFTQYDDGSSETNDYSCCRLLFSIDRAGAKTLRSAAPGHHRLYYADEEVSLAELPHDDWFVAWDYSGGGWSGVPVTYRVTQHFMDASGRETNTVVRGAKTPGVAADPDFPLRFGMRSSETTSYPHGFSDCSVSTDKRGVVTVFAERAYQDREETESLVYHPTNLTEWVSRTLTVHRRNGGSATTVGRRDSSPPQNGQQVFVTTNRSETCYSPVGRRIEYAVTESSDCGIVTNSVTYRDFLGRVSRRVTPSSDVVYSYAGGSSRETSEADSVSGLTTTRLYDSFGEERGMVSRGVTYTRDVAYEFASNAWWRLTTETTAGGTRSRASVARERLTGFSDAIRSETETYLDGALTLSTVSHFDPTNKVLTEVSESATSGTTTTKSKFGRVTETIDDTGTTSSFFDPYGLVYYTERDGRRNNWTGRNALGDIVEHDVFHLPHNGEYDEFYAYDVFGNRVVTTNALNGVTTSTYDMDGRLLETGGAVYPARYTYDTQGRRTSLSTTRDGTAWDTTSWAYDPATGLCTQKTYADNSAVSYTYTPDGLPLRTTYASGRWSENSYNSKRELASVEYSDGDTDFFAYDEFSQEVAASNNVASVACLRNNRGNVTNEIVSVSNDTISIVREYDAFGRLQATDGTSYTYAADGRIASISNGLAVVEYSYTNDRLDAGYSIALTNGMVFTRSLARHEYLRSDVTNIVSSANGAPVESFAYSYDALGRPVSRNADTFGYNARSEVTSHSPAGFWQHSYSYDEIGNSASVPANSLNQYVSGDSYDYDDDGNMTFCDYNIQLDYDARSRLASVSDMVYTNDMWQTVLLVSNCYDHIGRRVKKITPDKDTTFFYDGWNLIEERVAYSNGNSTMFCYYWGKDLSGTLQGAGGVGGLLYLTISTSNIEHQTSNPELYIPCYDNNGNVTRYLDANGATVAQYTYDAFGNLLNKSGPMCDVFRHRFSTKYYDIETGLYYYGYRFYCPWLMRWINRDPIEEDGGENVYGFVSNSPTFCVDVDGRRTWTEATARKEVSDKIAEMRKNGHLFAADALEYYLGNNVRNYDMSRYASEIWSNNSWQESFVRNVLSELKKKDAMGTGKMVEIGDVAHKATFDADLNTGRLDKMFAKMFEHRFYPNQSMGLFYALYGSRYSYVGNASWCATTSAYSLGEVSKASIKTDLKVVTWDMLTYGGSILRNAFPSYSAARYLQEQHGYNTPFIYLRWNERSQWELTEWNVNSRSGAVIVRK